MPPMNDSAGVQRPSLRVIQTRKTMVSSTGTTIPAEARAQLGLSDSLLRLSPGCENAEDLVEDLLTGLAELSSARAARKPVGAAAR